METGSITRNKTGWIQVANMHTHFYLLHAMAIRKAGMGYYFGHTNRGSTPQTKQCIEMVTRDLGGMTRLRVTKNTTIQA